MIWAQLYFYPTSLAASDQAAKLLPRENLLMKNPVLNTAPLDKVGYKIQLYTNTGISKLLLFQQIENQLRTFVEDVLSKLNALSIMKQIEKTSTGTDKVQHN